MQVWNFLPMPFIKTFTSRKKARKYIKKKLGHEFRWIGKSAQTDTFHKGIEIIAVITLDVDNETPAQKAAILAHECSHVVDAWMENIGEDNAGEEIRAYAIQCVMLACLDQLGEKWLIQPTLKNSEK